MNGDIEDLDSSASPISFTALASDALCGAMKGIFSDCEEIQEALEATGGEVVHRP
ncbi:MAG: hypothetical protein ABW201_08110 [Candidatus Thiodiazotropha sp.]